MIFIIHAVKWLGYICLYICKLCFPRFPYRCRSQQRRKVWSHIIHIICRLSWQTHAHSHTHQFDPKGVFNFTNPCLNFQLTKCFHCFTIVRGMANIDWWNRRKKRTTFNSYINHNRHLLCVWCSCLLIYVLCI